MYGHKPYDIHFMYFPALKLGFIAKQSKQTNKKKKEAKLVIEIERERRGKIRGFLVFEEFGSNYTDLRNL